MVPNPRHGQLPVELRTRIRNRRGPFLALFIANLLANESSKRMMESMTFWIAITTGIVCTLFSLWLWFFGHEWSMRHWNAARDGGAIPALGATRTKAILWGCGGLLAMFLMLFASGGDRHTLLEAEVPGSLGLAANGKVKVTRIPFVVENAGVPHKLLIWAKEGDDAALAKSNWGDVSFVVQVLGADDGQIHFDRVTAKNDKVGETSFTPAQAGRHTLAVAVTTLNIPKIHVLLTDPKKKDGKRMKGY